MNILKINTAIRPVLCCALLASLAIGSPAIAQKAPKAPKAASTEKGTVKKDAEKSSTQEDKVHINLAVKKNGKLVKIDTILTGNVSDERKEAIIDSLMAMAGEGKTRKKSRIRIKSSDGGDAVIDMDEINSSINEAMEEVGEELRDLDIELGELGNDLRLNLEELGLHDGDERDERRPKVYRFKRDRHLKGPKVYRWEYRYDDDHDEPRRHGARKPKLFVVPEMPELPEAPEMPERLERREFFHRGPIEPNWGNNAFRFGAPGHKPYAVRDTAIKGSIVKKTKEDRDALAKADVVINAYETHVRVQVKGTSSEPIVAVLADELGNEIARKTLDFESRAHATSLKVGADVPDKMLLQLTQGRSTLTKVIQKKYRKRR